MPLARCGTKTTSLQCPNWRAEASWAAAEACVQTHGGFAFAEEYNIERKFRETRLYQVAPISTNLILSFIAEHVLGMPRSY
jgi:acyl-CoA dehydrogenase